MAPAIQRVPVDIPRGMNLRAEPEDVGPGSAADLLNVQTNELYGAIQPREGCRSLAKLTSQQTGGHPAYPLGDGGWNWDETDDVLRIIVDRAQRRLHAIVRSGQDGDGHELAKVYRANMADASPGFALNDASESFQLDVKNVPSCAIGPKGRLFIATAVTAEHANVCIDLETKQVINEEPDPPKILPAAAGAPVSFTFDNSPVAGTDPGFTIHTGLYYKLCYSNSITGAQSAASPAVEVTPEDPPAFGQIQITDIPGSDDAAVWDRIQVYRTTDGGAVFRHAGDCENPGKGQVGSFTDSVADDRLSFKQLPKRRGRVPTCRFVMQHLDRMLWMVQTQAPFDGSVIYYSEPYHGFQVDPVYSRVTVEPEDGAVITLPFKLGNRAFVVKSNGAIFELIDVRPNAVYRVDPVVNEGPWGCVSHQTYVEINGVAYWLCQQGYCRFAGDGLPTLISGPIQPELIKHKPGHTFATGTTEVQFGSSALSFSYTNPLPAAQSRYWRVRLWDTERAPGPGSPLPTVNGGDPPQSPATPPDAPDENDDMADSEFRTGGNDEIQTLTVTATSGTFTLSFRGQESAALAWNISAGALDTALELLSTIGVGDVLCAGGPGATNPLTATFGGDLGERNVDMLVADVTNLVDGGGDGTVEITSTRQAAIAGRNEIQWVGLNPAPLLGDPWVNLNGIRLGFRGATSTTIFGDTTAAAFQTTLENISTIGSGNVKVTLPAPGEWVFEVEFIGDLGLQDLPELTEEASVWLGYAPWQVPVTQIRTYKNGTPGVAASSDAFGDLGNFRIAGVPLVTAGGVLVGGNSSVTVSVTPSVNERQDIAITGSADGVDQFRVTYGAQVTGWLEFDVSTADLETALLALSTISADGVSVAGGPGDYRVTFIGPDATTGDPTSPGLGPILLMTVEVAGAATAAVTRAIRGHYLIDGREYVVHVQGYGDTGYDSWQVLPLNYHHGSQTAIELHEIWWPNSRAFAVEYGSRHELWLFVPRASDGRITQAWVLDLNTLDAKTGPAWRRHLIHATAAVEAPGINLEEADGGDNADLLIFGDSYGLIWAMRGKTDRYIDRAGGTLADSQLVSEVTGTLTWITSGVGAPNLYTWGLSSVTTGSWPVPNAGTNEPGMKGQVVTVQWLNATGDGYWNTLTGIIRDNTATVLYVKFWLGSDTDARPSPESTGYACKFAIGGIDASATLFMRHFGNAALVKILKWIGIRTQGATADTRMRTEVRWGEESALPTVTNLARIKRRELALGNGRHYHELPTRGIRGRYIGFVIGGLGLRQDWQLSGFDVGLIPTKVTR